MKFNLGSIMATLCLFPLQVMAQPTPGSEIVTGYGPQSLAPSTVKLYRANGTPLPTQFKAFGTYTYGANVDAGGFDSDALSEILVGAGPGPTVPAHVKIFQEDGTLYGELLVGASTYGANVAAANVDGDAFHELITAPGPGSVLGPQIRGWNVDGGGATPMTKLNFYAYASPTYGANVGAGDIDGDGFDELLTGPGPGATLPAQLRTFDYDGTITTSGFSRNVFLGGYGVAPAAGDIDGDGRDEILVGQGPDPAGNDQFKGLGMGPLGPARMFTQDAYANADTLGVRLGACDLDGDGDDEILSGAQQDPGALSQIRGWSWGTGPLATLPGTQFDASASLGAKVAGGDFGF